MTRLLPHAVTFAIAVTAIGGIASAQTAASRSVRRIDVSVSGGLLGGTRFESQDANLRANDTARRAFRLFTSNTRIAAGPLFETRVGFAPTRRFVLEGGFAFSRPQLRGAISGDAEGAAPLTIVERIDQYFVDGSVILMLDEVSVGDRTVPFVGGGLGYLRQLHEGQMVIEEGHLYHLGGGVKHWFLMRERGALRAAGVRGDARLYWLARGISVGDDPRPHVAISGGVFIGF